MTPCTCHPGNVCASAASCAAARRVEFGENEMPEFVTAIDYADNPNDTTTNMIDVRVPIGTRLALQYQPAALPELQDFGPWHVSHDGKYIDSDNFNHDVKLVVQGDFRNDEQRRSYSLDIAKRLSRPALAALQSQPAAPGVPEGFDVQALTATGGGHKYPLIVVRDKSSQLGEDVYQDEHPVIYSLLSAWLAAAQAKGADPEDLAAAGVMLMGRRADHD